MDGPTVAIYNLLTIIKMSIVMHVNTIAVYVHDVVMDWSYALA